MSDPSRAVDEFGLGGEGSDIVEGNGVGRVVKGSVEDLTIFFARTLDEADRASEEVGDETSCPRRKVKKEGSADLFRKCTRYPGRVRGARAVVTVKPSTGGG